MINNIKNKNENNLSMMLSIIKIGIIAFISIIIYINLPKYWTDLKIENNGQFNLYTTAFFLCITGLCYITWLIINRKISQSSNIFKVSWLFENIFFISIISLPIYLSTIHENEYKYLFLLLILYSAIQYGSRYGIITSLFSSINILFVDLLYAPLEDGINIYFQKDLILVGIFIFVAWILGYYIDMEFKNNKRKDATLNMLSNELEEKDEQRKEMEALLLNNKICYDMLFENSLSAIIVHRNGKIIYANESTAKLLGYDNLESLYRNNFYNHYGINLKSKIQEKYLDIVSSMKLKIVEEENILKCSGEFIPVINTSSFFTYKGEPSIMTFLHDITSKKQVASLQEDVEKKLILLNETREFNNLITNFFTNMSHELKTPVNVIYAAIQTINIYLYDYTSENSVKCKSYLKTMKQNCLRMIRLINNLLDITKLDSGFIKINKKNGNIVSVIEDIVQSIAVYVESKDIQLIFDTDIEEKLMAFDHDMIERVMLNLISNAVKYSHSYGHIYVNIIDKTSSVVIEVKDEGEGIPEDKLKVIFERFGQVNSTLSRKCEGTGIGLYLVKSFIKMHGGKISVSSEEGMGSKFSIELPVILAENENTQDKALYKTKVEKIEIEFSDIYSIKD
ncbi:ATP-binding protein [Clostridium sp. C2-6-12]|uniref:sensor histidine kinase n=1 Tax=Clostridium sp. C2-6-12 TaxID=2698832 RepID=UPI00136BD73B|nr:ATP-binding protein [Clostridium sp. C2-6-12]